MLPLNHSNGNLLKLGKGHGGPNDKQIEVKPRTNTGAEGGDPFPFLSPMGKPPKKTSTMSLNKTLTKVF
jgi:hypothetical protein